MTLDRPVRSSSQSHAIWSNLIGFLKTAMLMRDRNRARQDLYLTIVDSSRIDRHRHQRRPGRDGSIPIENTTVARAHEKLGVWNPAQRAAKVRAINRERDEALRALAPQIGRAVAGNAGPWQRLGIFEGDLDSVADHKLVDRPNRSPSGLTGLHQRSQQRANN